MTKTTIRYTEGKEVNVPIRCLRRVLLCNLIPM